MHWCQNFNRAPIKSVVSIPALSLAAATVIDNCCRCSPLLLTHNIFRPVRALLSSFFIAAFIIPQLVSNAVNDVPPSRY